jgi:hypothetical protein
MRKLYLALSLWIALPASAADWYFVNYRNELFGDSAPTHCRSLRGDTPEVLMAKVAGEGRFKLVSRYTERDGGEVLLYQDAAGTGVAFAASLAACEGAYSSVSRLLQSNNGASPPVPAASWYFVNLPDVPDPDTGASMHCLPLINDASPVASLNRTVGPGLFVQKGRGKASDGKEVLSFQTRKGEWMIFAESPAACEEMFRSVKANRASSPANREPQISLVGDTLRYPKGVGEKALLAAAPDLTCRKFEGDRVCTGAAPRVQSALLIGLPGNGQCKQTAEVVVALKGGKVVAASCDIEPTLARQIMAQHNAQFGGPTIDTKSLQAMNMDFYEWKVGSNYVMVTEYYGSGYGGVPVNNVSVSVSSRSNLPVAPPDSR